MANGLTNVDGLNYEKLVDLYIASMANLLQDLYNLDAVKSFLVVELLASEHYKQFGLFSPMVDKEAGIEMTANEVAELHYRNNKDFYGKLMNDSHILKRICDYPISTSGEFYNTCISSLLIAVFESFSMTYYLDTYDYFEPVDDVSKLFPAVKRYLMECNSHDIQTIKSYLT